MSLKALIFDVDGTLADTERMVTVSPITGHLKVSELELELE